MVDSSLWWEFQPRERVMTREGFPGRVVAIEDGPGPGNEQYEVKLDGGQGGGFYSSSELRRLGGAKEAAADSDYPELGGLLAEKPPPSRALSLKDYLSGLPSKAFDVYELVNAAMSRVASDGGDHDNSAMVALEIPPEVAQKVAVNDGIPAEQMHVTLAYLPNPDEDQIAKTHEVVANHAGMLGPIKTSIGGLGQFPAGDDGIPYYGPVEDPSDAMNSLQASLVTALESAGVEVGHDHGFTPHMTLTYLPEGEEPPAPLAPHEATLSNLVVAQGDNWTRYPLGGRDDTTEAIEDLQDLHGDKAASLKTADDGMFSDLMHGRPGPNVNFDWCRYRTEQHCNFPKNLNGPLTIQSGEAQWEIEDRGFCPRTWAKQALCPIGAPGPNAYAMASKTAADEEIEIEATAPAPDEHDVLDFILAVGGTPTMAEPNYITREEARGNSRPVTREEYRNLADQGRSMLDTMHRGRAPISGLDNNWDSLKRNTWGEVQKPWGGATIDSHTGVPLESNADKYALTVKPGHMNSVSVHEGASQDDFNRAMDHAREQFRPLLENQKYHLGVFHDDDNHRIDMDPVAVVDTPDEVEKIGAHTHAIGGAYHFKSGNGYFPPHVSDEVALRKGSVGEENEEPDFKGPGHWRSQAEQVQPGYTHVLPEDETGE